MKKGRAIALLPIGVFLTIYLGLGLSFEYGLKIPMGFYKIPIVIAFLAAILTACLQNRSVSFDQKLEWMAQGVGDKNIITMLLIFMTAGAFVGVVGNSSAQSVAYFMLSVIDAKYAVAVLFVVACFVSTAMGTSVGTITLLTPIAVEVALSSELNVALCVGTIVGGAMFGDNLSMISDTTIAATRTQGCDMKDKFRENFKIALPAAILTAILLFLRTKGNDYVMEEALEYNFIRIVPYLVVLIGALAGLNVFMLLVGGTVLSLCIGIAYGDFTLIESFGIMGEGIMGMYDITVISIIVAGLVSLVRQNGGIDWLLYIIRRCIHGPKGAQIGIAALSSVVDCSTANNTVAIVIAGPIAKEIASDYDISPKRTASLLDIFTSVFQGLIPYGAQLLYASAATATAAVSVSSVEIVPFCYYPILLGICALVFIIFEKKKS